MYPNFISVTWICSRLYKYFKWKSHYCCACDCGGKNMISPVDDDLWHFFRLGEPMKTCGMLRRCCYGHNFEWLWRIILMGPKSLMWLLWLGNIEKLHGFQAFFVELFCGWVSNMRYGWMVGIADRRSLCVFVWRKCWRTQWSKGGKLLFSSVHLLLYAHGFLRSWASFGLTFRWGISTLKLGHSLGLYLRVQMPSGF